jgi:hypothetical protein
MQSQLGFFLHRTQFHRMGIVTARYPLGPRPRTPTERLRPLRILHSFRFIGLAHSHLSLDAAEPHR